MSFTRILLRGFSAARGCLAGLMLLVVLYGWFDGAEIVFGDTVDIRAVLAPLGDGPPPEDLVPMVRGCLTCVWLPVTLFGAPWVVGGMIGQLRDRMIGRDVPTASFGTHAEMFYVPILVLSLTFLAVQLLLTIPLGLLEMALSGAASHPDLAKLLSKARGALIGGGIKLVFILASTVVVTEYEEPFASLKRALLFLRRHIADGVKLLAAVIALRLAWWLPQQALRLICQQHLTMLAVLGAITAVCNSWIMLQSVAWTVSLWLARRPGEEQILDVTDVELTSG